MYGEWLFAKHTIFYDALSHYFHEFDVWDKEREIFLSTSGRRCLLKGLPVMPVPVLYEGQVGSLDELLAWVKPSLYKTGDWAEALANAAIRSGSRPDIVEKQTEDSDLACLLYTSPSPRDATLSRMPSSA